jgi:hypothetical protein
MEKLLSFLENDDVFNLKDLKSYFLDKPNQVFLEIKNLKSNI